MSDEQHPPSWLSTNLGAVIDGFETGRNIRAHGRPASGSEYGVLKVSAVSWGRFKPEENKALLPGDAPRPRELVRKGDLLISRANTSELVGAVVRVRGEHPTLMLPDKLLRLCVRSTLADPDFLIHALRLPSVRKHFEVNATGTSDSMRNLSQPKIEAAPILLPPLNEQRRIVAKLEALQARSGRAREALDAVPPLLEKLRQSILAAAFRGDLTKDWRAKHKNVEPASELLKRIRIERKKKWEESELAKMKAKGKAPTDDKWKAKYKEPAAVDTTGLPELPEGWCWASVEEAGEVELGRMRSPDKHRGENVCAYLRVKNVYEDRIDVRDVMEMQFEPEEFELYRLVPGDILLNEGQSKELVGRPAMFRGELPNVAFTNSLLRFRPYGAAPPEYALALFRHYLRSGRFQQVAQITTNIAHLGATRLRQLEYPLAPAEEQSVIATRVGEMLARLGGFDRTREDLCRQRSSLDASCLAKAFRGELVPQDPNDEPAHTALAGAQPA